MSDMTDTGSIRKELTQRDELSLYTRIASDPKPFLRWAVPMLVLIAVEFPTYAGIAVGTLDAAVIAVTGLLEVLLGLISTGLAQSVAGAQNAAVGVLRDAGGFVDGLPHLFSREVIPNQGYKAGPNGPWKGTFLGLEPAYAWALRALLIVAYALLTSYWVFQGWVVYRAHYREADWTPTDDIVDNLRNHQWGKFGLLVLVLFLTMAVFGSALGPTTVEQNIMSPYSDKIQYFNGETGTVDDIYPGQANFNSKSKGSAEFNVGPMSYDDYGRFHPFGTLTNGRDLFTFMMGGARITLMVAGIAIGGAALVAALLSMISAYYGGSVDLAVLTTADGVVSIPRLLLLILISAVFANHWLGNVLNGGFLLALIFAFTTWPFLWRAVRGPALQVAQEEWILAAKSYGQQPRKIMRKHMFPYIVGYLLVYASMSAGGIIIGLAALSFLGNGLGISPPTPAWGRAISMGQDYVSSPSWHISMIPGLMIVLLVTGLNALGDGIRDAIDPEAGSTEGEEAAAGGGG
ncbi:ABC transporter permease [Halapricum desulfuricans]|uniref:ABC-type dipeptide/oligopeptide/nickel transportsystem, permease component n=1 Tax=Halapricum desulfuricans TaxID=2841257 RepID=A0A897N826_9EURY|nr:ABC transporter permease [Halapricum desulfuricans]QSG08847.1 ABC-type dipeptide/oligopeptide/nickel transportsystem, permease component [Halapricum desulfuricans]